MQSCCFGFEQHRGRWAVFSAAFHHAERAPRVISSLTAESPTIRSFKTSFGPDIGSLTTRVLTRSVLVNQDGISNLRYLPESDSENDSKLERSVICMSVVKSRRGDSRCFFEMMLVA